MNPSKVIEREKRWALPVAICAFAAIVLLVASVLITNGVTSGEGSVVETITEIAGKRSTLVIGGIVRALGMLCMAVTLIYLFEAAFARSNKIRRWMGVIVLVGPLLLGVHAIYSGLALHSTASDFVAAESTLYTEPPASADEFVADLEETPNMASEAITYEGENAIDVLDSDGKVFTLETADAAEKDEVVAALEGADIEVEERTTGAPGDLAVAHFFSESRSLSTATQLIFVALLSLIVGVVYTSLWSMRVGLLTRFLGTLGIALGAAQVIVGPEWGSLGLGLWLVAVGLLILNRLPGGRPPAWDAGEAVPWPVRGQEPPGDGNAAADDGDVIDEPVGESAQPTPGTSLRKRKQRSQ